MQNQLKQLKDEIIEKLNLAETLDDLEKLRLEYLGRRGKLAEIFKQIKKVAEEEKPVIGKLTNEVKSEIERIFEKLKLEISDSVKEPVGSNGTSTGQRPVIRKMNKIYDVTVPGVDQKIGTLHPVTQVKDELNDAFKFLGFEVYEGPEISSEGYDFDYLNFPADHPARESMDTYWIKQPTLRLRSGQAINKQQLTINKQSFRQAQGRQATKGVQKLCLRPHLTGASVRYMQTHRPPFRFVYPGRVFRSEATDAGHEKCFYQWEALIVNKDISLAGGKILVKTILERVFGREVKVRMRAGFFPFVEPGFEIDMECLVCGGKGCSVCKGNGWLEMMPGGPPHPNVLKAGGIDPEKWQGFYINIGLDRLTMMKYGIDDIRLFHGGDLRFLRQF